MTKFRLAIVFLLVLGEPGFSAPVQTGQSTVPEQTVSLVLLSQPAKGGMRQSSPGARFMAALSEASLMSQADGLCEGKTIALRCASRAPSAIRHEVTE